MFLEYEQVFDLYRRRRITIHTRSGVEKFRTKLIASRRRAMLIRRALRLMAQGQERQDDFTPRSNLTSFSRD